MSHWLSNVNNLLTKLDDQVETVVEERVLAQNDLSSFGAAGTGIDDILAKRGLSTVDSKEEVEEKEGEPKEYDEDKQHSEFENETNTAEESEVPIESDIETKPSDIKESLGESSEVDATNDAAHKGMQRNQLENLGNNSSALSPELSQDAVLDKAIDETEQSDKGNLSPNKETEANPIENSESHGSSAFSKPTKLTEEPPLPKATKHLKSVFSTLPGSASLSLNKEQGLSHRVQPPHSSTKEIRELAMERKEAQKEARTLRRHIVSLNNQLETAESELHAQRQELERAAERMEKDRVRHKEEKDVSKKRNDDELTQLKSEHTKRMEAQQARFEEQLDRYRKKLSDEEQRRKQEGGDWNKEMSNAIDREQEVRRTLNLLEDEKAVLLSQISTLQGQQAALGSRLESLSQAADNAMDRERDAETRLEVALNQHARQISHRQARELQLEKTIQDLNAALVTSRGNGELTSTISNSDTEGTSNDSLREKSHLEARIRSLESDLETANSHLGIEKERSETLQMQLRNFSDETTQEANIVYAKEIEYDRRMADMSKTISNLEAEVRRYETSMQNSNQPVEFLNDQQTPHQLKFLSEEVVRLRDKIASHNSESLAMKNRLKASLDRTERLEEELHAAKSAPNGNTINSNLTRHNKNVPTGTRRRVGASSSVSIRSAMLLNSSQGNTTEKIGQVVDQIDSFAASTGKYLRRNPFARAGFILYLVLIHLWTSVLLLFHAHSLDNGIATDFGTLKYAHGPQAVLHQHINNLNQTQNAVDSNEEKHNLRQAKSIND